MQIVLPGALPDPGEARELAAHLPKAAPTFAHWLALGHAHVVSADPAQAGCTPYEQWQLHTRGFVPRDGQPFSSGLGPLLAGAAASEEGAIWLAELVHMAPSRDGAALLPARDLAIEPEQSVALFEAAQTLLPGSGFAMRQADTNHWRVLPDDPATLPTSASPALVGVTSVNDWWPQDIETRPWRRLINELQMLWFDHPVNRQRARHGLPEINSLWVFGGASGNQFHAAGRAAQPEIREDLIGPSIRHDWSGWLSALEGLERALFAPLARAGSPPNLILTGRERYVELQPRLLGGLRYRLPGGHNRWRIWWSPQD